MKGAELTAHFPFRRVSAQAGELRERRAGGGWLVQSFTVFCFLGNVGSISWWLPQQIRTPGRFLLRVVGL